MSSRLFEILMEKQYLERMLLENRLDFLRQKYVPLINAFFGNAFDKKLPIYNQIFDVVPNGDFHDDKVFDWLVSLDPTSTKKYAQWILNIFLKNDFSPEDSYKITQYIATFERVKHLMPVDQRDINRFKSYKDLFNAVQPYQEQISKAEMDRLYKDSMTNEAKVVFNDSNYKIVIPLTKKAACHFGINTQWCTAASDSDQYNYFDQYNQQGDLYIILDKKNNKRWQFHFESEQFMDENDNGINFSKFEAEHPFIVDFFEKMIGSSETEYNRGDDLAHYRVFKTDKGYLIKTDSKIYSKIVGRFNVSKDGYLIGGDWHYTVNEREEKRISYILNQLGVKGKDHIYLAFADIYYRNNKWGSFVESSEAVVYINTHYDIGGDRQEVWRVIENTHMHGNSTAVGAVFRLCNEYGHVISSNGRRVAYEVTLTSDGQFRTYFAYTTNLDELLMPLIEARPDIKYWGYKSGGGNNFWDLSIINQYWILDNRPTLCDPQFAYKRKGLTEDIKDTILKKLEGTTLQLANLKVPSQRPRWIDDHLMVYQWTGWGDWEARFMEMLKDVGFGGKYNSYFVYKEKAEADKQLRVIPWLYYYDSHIDDKEDNDEMSENQLTSYKKGFMKGADYCLLIPVQKVIELTSSDRFSEMAQRYRYWFNILTNTKN